MQQKSFEGSCEPFYVQTLQFLKLFTMFRNHLSDSYFWNTKQILTVELYENFEFVSEGRWCEFCVTCGFTNQRGKLLFNFYQYKPKHLI